METFKISEIIADIDKCIKTLCMKFREAPYNFFTESDAHSYLYYSFFRYGTRSLKIPYSSKDGERAVLVHREYPTFFRYSQKRFDKAYPLNEKKGTRGHYDMVVLSPSFVAHYDIQQVISKDIRLWIQDNKVIDTFNGPHLLAAIEFKLLHLPLTNHMQDEIYKDFEKLRYAKEKAQKAIMLLFNRYENDDKRYNSLVDSLKGRLSDKNYAHIELIPLKPLPKASGRISKISR